MVEEMFLVIAVAFVIFYVAVWRIYITARDFMMKGNLLLAGNSEGFDETREAFRVSNFQVASFLSTVALIGTGAAPFAGYDPKLWFLCLWVEIWFLIIALTKLGTSNLLLYIHRHPV